MGSMTGNYTENTSVWRPEPTTRGTWNLISTSLITLALCTWTAVHLNIPGHGEKDKQKWRKAAWLTLGLFAPEMVSTMALSLHPENIVEPGALEHGYLPPHSTSHLVSFRYMHIADTYGRSRGLHISN
jgi:hypothetical protein